MTGMLFSLYEVIVTVQPNQILNIKLSENEIYAIESNNIPPNRESYSFNMMNSIENLGNKLEVYIFGRMPKEITITIEDKI